MLTLSIRQAVPADSAAIVSVMRCASTALIRHTTIIGCAGLEAYLHDEIAAGSRNHYLVAVSDDLLIGMSAWRCKGEYLFLNHLFVLPSAQGQGVGAALLSHGMTHFQFRQPRYLAVDVHEDNAKARSWYQALGMAGMAQGTLMEVPLIAPKATVHGDWSSTFLGASDPDYVRYGFSQFTLTTDQMTYTIGRLGLSLFRATAWAILDDDAALTALHVLDNNRALLCIDTPQGLTSAVRRRGVVLGQTERLTAPLEALADRLRKRCVERGPLTEQMNPA